MLGSPLIQNINTIEALSNWGCDNPTKFLIKIYESKSFYMEEIISS